MANIVKRSGQVEEFDERKVYASIFAACLDSHIHHTACEVLSKDITDRIKVWIQTKEVVSSEEITSQVLLNLQKDHSQVAFNYRNYKKSGQ